MSDETFGRTFNAARRDQGFKSQQHLDAFFAAYDHSHSCPECLKPGTPVAIDDGMQPTMNRCSEGMRLDRASFSENFSEGRVK